MSSSVVFMDSDYEFWPVELRFRHVLLAVLLWLMAQWLYRQITMSGTQRKTTAVNVLAYSLSALGRAIVCMHHLDMNLRLMELFECCPFSGTPTSVNVSKREILEDVPKTQFKAFDHGFLDDMLGDGFFSRDGASCVKTALHLFGSSAVCEAMISSVHKRMPVLLNVLQRGMEAVEPVDLTKLLDKFTLEMLTETCCGVDLGCLDSPEDHPFRKAFDSAQAILLQRSSCPAWLWKTLDRLRLGREKGLKTHLESMNDLVLGIISESLGQRAATQRLQTPPEETEPLSARRSIVSLWLDEGGDIDPSTLRDIVMSFLLAGRDCTAQVLSWAFLMLNQYPAVEREIRDEIAAKIPELLSGEITAPTVDQVSELYYLEATLLETLRLFPPAPDILLCGGTSANVGAMLFNPTRWIEPESGHVKPVSSITFSVFGLGSRHMLTMHLAMMKIVAASILVRYHLGLISGQRVAFEPSSIVLPKERTLLVVRVEPV